MKRILFTIARWIGRVVLATAVLVLVLVVVFDMRLEFNGGLRPGVVFGDPDEHYADLEADRLGQSATPTAPNTAVEPAPRRQSVATAPVWTDFRGPNRDGQYTDTPILTNWPGTGLDPLWTQPVGGGYASFVVADGLAYTIEQLSLIHI